MRSSALFTHCPTPIRTSYFRHKAPPSVKHLPSLAISTEKKPSLFFPYQVHPENKSVFHASLRMDDDTRAHAPYSKCLLTISLGQLIHQGPLLASTLSVTNQSFKSCGFALGDTLQAYTCKIQNPDISLKEIKDQMRAEGNQWIREHSHLLALLTIPWSITRWDSYLNDPEFEHFFASVKHCYEHEPDYRAAFDKNIKDYLNRLPSPLSISRIQAENLCLDFLLEECAVLLIWSRDGWDYELYPQGRGPAMEATYKRFILPHHPNKLRCLKLRIKKEPGMESKLLDTNDSYLKFGIQQSEQESSETAITKMYRNT